MKRRELTLRMDEQSYEQLRQAAFDLRISKQQALTEAVALWLALWSEHHAKKVAKLTGRGVAG